MNAKILSFLSAMFLTVGILSAQSEFMSDNNNYGLTFNGTATEFSVEPDFTTIINPSSNLEILEIKTIFNDELKFDLKLDNLNRYIILEANYSYYEPVEYALYNASGKEVRRSKLSADEHTVLIDDCSAGTYILHLFLDEDSSQVFRIRKT